jgi:conjugal transfer pilus assembly protein TraA
MKMQKKLAAAAALMLVSGVALAAAAEGETFGNFQTTVESWVGGPLGVGLSLTMLLMGAGIGVAKNSPMPALSGIAGAAFLHWGPEIIYSIMGSGAVI